MTSESSLDTMSLHLAKEVSPPQLSPGSFRQKKKKICGGWINPWEKLIDGWKNGRINELTNKKNNRINEQTMNDQWTCEAMKQRTNWLMK